MAKVFEKASGRTFVDGKTLHLIIGHVANYFKIVSTNINSITDVGKCP